MCGPDMESKLVADRKVSAVWDDISQQRDAMARRAGWTVGASDGCLMKSGSVMFL